MHYPTFLCRLKSLEANVPPSPPPKKTFLCTLLAGVDLSMPDTPKLPASPKAQVTSCV